ncbi:MAG TPA: hypothetical protein HPP97_06980 [Desulfuromonadales bacterium]|nr:hypothetical protein [Desulfuromonadales bacterium]
MKVRYINLSSANEYKEYIRKISPANVASYKILENGFVDLSVCWAENPELHEYPILCSPAVWKLIDSAAKNPNDKDDHMDIIWDILWMNYVCGTKFQSNGNIFPVEIDCKKYTLIMLKNKIPLPQQYGEIEVNSIFTISDVVNSELIDIN